MKTNAATGLPIRNWKVLPKALIWLLVMGATYGVNSFPMAEALEKKFSIVPKESRVVLLVARDGVLAVLAHDHAMVAADISGAIHFNIERPEKSSLRLSIPVKGLQVDLPAERKRLKLGGELSKGDVREIREIMLSPRVLDATRFPTVEITSIAVSGPLGKLTLKLKMRIREVERVFNATARVTVTGDVLRARGEFSFLQTHFGIKPYSTLLGAIAVEDKIHIKFDVVARAEGS